MRNFFSLLTLTLIISVFVSCSSSTDNSDGDNENASKRTYLDTVGDVPYSFVDLDSLEIAIEDSNVVILLSMTAIPDTLIYDQNEVPVNKLEYQWSVAFDLDRNMSVSEGDLLCGLLRFKSDSIATEKSGSILDFTQKDIFQYTSNGTWHRISPIEANIMGSTIILHIRQAELTLLGIGAAALLNAAIKFETAYYKDQTYWDDTFPDSGYVGNR